MNVKWTAGLVLGLLATVAATTTGQQQASALKTEKEMRSYALGMDLGNQLRKLSVEVDPAVFAKGLGDALAGAKTSMTDEEAKAAISRLQAELKARQFQTKTGKRP